MLGKSIRPGLMAVATLRKEAVKQAKTALASANRQLADAELSVIEARAALKRQVDQQIAAPAGRMTGAAMQRAGAFLAQARDQAEALRSALEGREGALEGARRRVDRAREALRQAYVEAQLVERHQDRKTQEARRDLEQRAQDEADGA